jgi:hypothetical protein
MTVGIAKVRTASRLDTQPAGLDVPTRHHPNVAARVIVLALLFLAALLIGTMLFVFSGADPSEIYGPYFVT